jgi:uncharacterized protein YegL
MAKQKKATKKVARKESKSVLVNLILDKSGSMLSVLGDTIGGFNTYINELKKDKKIDYQFSLTLFDTNLENRYVSVPLSKVQNLDENNYRPSGNTALYDAIGVTVAKIEKDNPEAEKVLTVIMTDGQENSSREYKSSVIKDLIARKEKEGNWTFVFLGATPDTWHVGDSLGIKTSNSILYNTQNMGATFAATAQATSGYAMSAQCNTNDLYKFANQNVVRAAGMSRRLKEEDKDPFESKVRGLK